jgi:hypothetical protein
VAFVGAALADKPAAARTTSAPSNGVDVGPFVVVQSIGYRELDITNLGAGLRIPIRDFVAGFMDVQCLKRLQAFVISAALLCVFNRFHQAVLEFIEDLVLQAGLE